MTFAIAALSAVVAFVVGSVVTNRRPAIGEKLAKLLRLRKDQP